MWIFQRKFFSLKSILKSNLTQFCIGKTITSQCNVKPNVLKVIACKSQQWNFHFLDKIQIES